jgi:hypothetical protein
VTEPQAQVVVTNTANSGPGSLRQAIIDANTLAGADTITFAIPGAGTRIINLLSPLPDITGPLTIDGTTQPGFAGSPLIALRGGNGGSTLKITAGNSVVRGLDICSPFTGFGPFDIEIINAGNNRIEGNVISEAGIQIRTANNVVGGTAASARNIFVSQGTAKSVQLSGPSATGNSILGNLFAQRASCKPVISPPCGIGVSIASANNNSVGGTAAGARNIFAGSFSILAISVFEATGILIQGNLVGTDATGTISAGARVGIDLSNALNCTIGGTTPAARNIVSGLLLSGIGISSPEGVRNGILVQGNYIGTDITGTQALANGSGIVIGIAPGTTIGGATTGARNIISGNTFSGIIFGTVPPDPCNIPAASNRSSEYLVQGNYIGTDVSGTQSIGNGGDGIFVTSDAFTHEIRENRIAFNGQNGVKITEQLGGFGAVRPGFRIRIFANLIFSNRRLGIELGDDGATANDLRDLDAGANERQNFPVIQSAAVASQPSDFSAAIDGTITLTFNSTPLQTFTVEFFFGSNCQASGSQFIGAIPVYLGSRQVTTDANGNATFPFTFTFPAGVPSGFVNATATNATGNTSEFSECRLLVNPGLPQITGATKSGKKLFVTGANFLAGAKILINGEEQKTKVDSSVMLIGKKAGKKIKSGDKIRVRNPEGLDSTEITFP